MREVQQSNRFKDAAWFPEQVEEVIIGGAGGIGSWLTMFLVRAGFSPTVFDFDRVEEHNLGGQLFRQSDIGATKVSSVLNIVKEFTGDDVSIIDGRYQDDSMFHRYMFSAFDNMDARKTMFNSWKKSIANSVVTPVFIDGRLEMEQLQIFAVTPDRIEEYENEHLFSDAEVEDAPCTMRQTTHSAAMIASLMVGIFTNHISNIYLGEKVRTVPFKYEFYIPGMLTNFEN